MKLRSILLSLVLALSACATGPPTAKDWAAVDIGWVVSQQDAEEQATRYLDRALKDPESKKVEFLSIQKGWQRYAWDLHLGWRMVAYVNARNGFGGYTGSRQWVFMFANGSLDSVFRESYAGGRTGGTYMRKVR